MLNVAFIFWERENDKMSQIQDKNIFEGSENDD